MANGTFITLIGNLVEDPELRFTPVAREFAITEAAVRLNSRLQASS
ncbi:hypothetical protein [Nonomuraea soli]|uniref:Single-stranded DNA-binding protein n=1 Tax=Nonomuraea soli TaxID=1032476 RepID=A0A7W0HW64_9ACTN|nr:hypothetical protein [Nonomuraea soli]MBA2897772.1 single-stranded DNA-binding protein [Nonomuraea soli]